MRHQLALKILWLGFMITVLLKILKITKKIGSAEGRTCQTIKLYSKQTVFKVPLKSKWIFVFDSLLSHLCHHQAREVPRKVVLLEFWRVFLFFWQLVTAWKKILKILMTHPGLGGGYSLIRVQVDDVLFSIFWCPSAALPQFWTELALRVASVTASRTRIDL